MCRLLLLLIPIFLLSCSMDTNSSEGSIFGTWVSGQTSTDFGRVVFEYQFGPGNRFTQRVKPVGEDNGFVYNGSYRLGDEEIDFLYEKKIYDLNGALVETDSEESTDSAFFTLTENALLLDYKDGTGQIELKREP